MKRGSREIGAPIDFEDKRGRSGEDRSQGRLRSIAKPRKEADLEEWKFSASEEAYRPRKLISQVSAARFVPLSDMSPVLDLHVRPVM